MNTVKDYKTQFDNMSDEFKISREHTVHLINQPGPGTPFDVVGSFGYRTKSHNGYKVGYFIMSNGNRLRSSGSAVKEEELIIRLAETLENKNNKDGLVVVDARLPKGHGFSGVKKALNILRVEQ